MKTFIDQKTKKNKKYIEGRKIKLIHDDKYQSLILGESPLYFGFLHLIF